MICLHRLIERWRNPRGVADHAVALELSVSVAEPNGELLRGWKDEHGDRLAVAALALAQLHRPRQAAAFLRRAVAEEPWLGHEVRDRLAALEQADCPGRRVG